MRRHLTPSSGLLMLPQAPEELVGAATQHGNPTENFMSSLLRQLEGFGKRLPAASPQRRHGVGNKQILARKWWECGGYACDEAQRKKDEEAAPSVGIHMGALDKYRKKNCRTAECIYGNAATGFNVPGTGKNGHRWNANGEVGLPPPPHRPSPHPSLSSRSLNQRCFRCCCSPQQERGKR
jgi:hypothetical protein